MPHGLNTPHGGGLIDLLIDSERAATLQEASREWLSWDLTPRQLCDLELLLNGGFSPLRGFMARADYEAVCTSMRLTDGTIWPIPITLDTAVRSGDVQSGDTVLLTGFGGGMATGFALMRW